MTLSDHAFLPTQYDAIVVGAGPAGSTAAYFMAKEGMKVLLVERGPYPSAKSCGGASLIASHTHLLFPNFWEEVHCERIVTDQAYWLMTEDTLTSVRIQSQRFAAAPYNRFTIKRFHLYHWLAAKAVDAGCTLLLNTTAERIEFERGQAVAVQLKHPVLASAAADIIIAADGAHSGLTRASGLPVTASPHTLSLYAKETLALPAAVIEERFNLQPGCGAIIGLLGYPTAGFNGTGSIHTFTDSININVGMSLHAYMQAGIRPAALLQRIKQHPLLQPYLAKAVSLEYGCQMIPEGGYHAIPQLVYDGLLIIGDAASLVNGTHGFNLAMWSGYFAAKAALAAKHAHDFSRKRLSLYTTLLEESFVLQDLKSNASLAVIEAHLPYLFTVYSKLACEAAYQSAAVYPMPKTAKRRMIFHKLTSIQPLGKIARDFIKSLLLSVS